MSVYQPVEFKVFVVVAEGVDQLLGDLEEAHVEEELEDGEDGDVEVDVDGNSPAGHPHVFTVVSNTKALNLLSTDEGEDEEEVGGKGDHLRIVGNYNTWVDQGNQVPESGIQIPEVPVTLVPMCSTTREQVLKYQRYLGVPRYSSTKDVFSSTGE